MISGSSYFGITASAQFYKSKIYGLRLWRRQIFTLNESWIESPKVEAAFSTNLILLIWHLLAPLDYPD